MTREELLLELRDIGEPAEPAWWLLAPGHVILLGFALTVIGLLWFSRRRRQNRRPLRLARAEFDAIKTGFDRDGDCARLSLELSRWLKQVALLAFPERRLAGLSGAGWLAFLDETLGESRFSRGDGRAFGDAIYQRHAQLDADRLLALCENWLSAIEPRLLARGRE